MKNLPTYIVVLLAVCLTSCKREERLPEAEHPQAVELKAIKAVIETGGPATRAGTVTPLADYVGRDEFVTNDKVTFTEIRRTSNPLTQFTYPGDGNYDGIIFQYGSEGGWSRVEDDGPERVYWTDAASPHVFIAYSIPQDDTFDWKKYPFTQDETKKTYYIGSLGNPYEPGNITYSDENALQNEDLLLSYREDMQAEPGGSVALVKFYHGLSSIRVIVNISGFSAGSQATADNAAVVSNMKLLHQPTMYIWMQANAGAQPLRAEKRTEATLTDQQMVNMAYTGSADGSGPAYNQRKDMLLWIPAPAGTGNNQSKRFTFYGITTPQDADYIGTLAENDANRKVELSFNVTYPDPLKPSTTVTKPYTASLSGVYFEPGYNTTINISLNHKNEQMTVGAEYENWQFIATPDVGQLRKNSTFLKSTAHDGVNVTIVGDAKATADDATWLYELNNTVYDIYGHTGEKSNPYQISTANQLLSLAYEVKSGRDFADKYIRLDADLTLQDTTLKKKPEITDNGDIGTLENAVDNAELPLEWIGIGDADHAFNGTFLGGDRFIYRLYGKPLFANLGSSAIVRQVQVQAMSIGNTIYTSADGEGLMNDSNKGFAVDGSGLFADNNAGRISGCRVVGDVSLNGTVSGAFVGSNTGVLYASYHIGDTKGKTTTGGLAGTNAGTISGCYQAGVVAGSTTQRGISGSSTGTIVNTYFNSSMFSYDGISSGVEGRTSTEMTKETFVKELNNGIYIWLQNSGLSNYTPYHYLYQPANYPRTESGAPSDTRQAAGLAWSASEATAAITDSGTSFPAPPTLGNPNGLAVTYASSDTGTATIDASSGAVTIVAAGTTTISATFAGNLLYNAATVSYTLTVTAPTP